MELNKKLLDLENTYATKRQLFNDMSSQVKVLEIELIGIESNVEFLKKLINEEKLGDNKPKTKKDDLQ